MTGLLLLGVLTFLLPTCIKGATEVRLVGGRTPYMGRLEVRNDSQESWGTVCEDQFDQLDASIVCRMLGFKNTEYAAVVRSQYDQGSGLIKLDKLECSGNETDIFDCQRNGLEISDCDHSQDVGVNCHTPLRLEDGVKNHQGIVEIQSNGSWKPMCADGFNLQTGQVICRMLGFSTGDVVISEVEPRGSDDLCLNMATCSGVEYDISNCNWTDSLSSNGTIARLDCRTAIRLKNGPNNQTGRVEVFFNEEWGTVCDDSFDNNDASVICGMLGFKSSSAKAHSGAVFGASSGQIFISGLKCAGTETDVSECKSNIWGSDTKCAHGKDAAVECVTDLRLMDGPNNFAGRLEIRHGNVWESMCYDSFNISEATVVCNMLGFIRGNITVHTVGYFGYGSSALADYTVQCSGNESDIVECSHINSSAVCSPNQTVGINCFGVTPARLVGGPTPFGGRVEVYLHKEGKWSGICETSYNFTVNDAKVICRMIGKPNADPSVHNASSIYNYTIRGKAISNLNCDGSEADISDCRAHIKWGQKTCDYPDYVGINCDPVTPVRLLDGPSSRAGRVEILFNGTWGSVCSDGFDIQDAAVICKMLGYGNLSYLLAIDKFRQGQAPTIINLLDCKGHENDISDCKAAKWDSNGTCLKHDVGVACGSRVRLVNGSNERSGRVEIFQEGEWHTICADSFDDEDANVTCKMAGFRFWNATVLPGSFFGHGSGTSYLNNVTCSGNETDLIECVSSPWNITSCQTNMVAAVDCSIQKTPIRLTGGVTQYSGFVEIFHNAKWGEVCGTGFTREDAKIVCEAVVGPEHSPYFRFESKTSYKNLMIKNLACSGNETDISLCPSNDWDSGNGGCNNDHAYVDCLTKVTLIGGMTQYTGIVQVTYNKTLSSIRGDQFSVQNAEVLCSMMGYNFTKHLRWQTDDFHFKMPSDKISIAGMKCHGDEIDIYNCPSEQWNITNSSKNAIAINCKTSVRLSNGQHWRSGKVEVYNRSGNWSTVCFSNSTQNLQNSKLVCKMLGLSTSSEFVKYFEVHDNNTDGIELFCDGTEDDISKCRTDKSGCPTPQRLGTTCETKIKLVNGRTQFMGEVSVEHFDGRYNSIFQTKGLSPQVICRMLGYNLTRYSEIQPSNDFKNEYIHNCSANRIGNIDCDGTESDIMDCINSTWNYYKDSCAASGVNCQTPIRLTDGKNFQFGNVEVKISKEWYPICSDAFTLEDAYVVCRMFGHKHVRNATYRSVENATIGLHYLHCNGSEVDISQCSHGIAKSNCTLGTVRINCSSDVRLVDGPVRFRGRGEVYYDGSWGPICNYNAHKAIKVLCRMMGFNYNNVIYHTGVPYSNKTYSSTDFYITNFECNGYEDDITECSYNWKTGEHCPNSLPLEIECNTRVYLEYGSNEYIGRVLAVVNDNYYSICADNFTTADAEVICRMLGYQSNGTAKFYRGNKYGGGYNTYLQQPRCLGDELDLQQCRNFLMPPTHDVCSRQNTAVAVNCRPNTQIRINSTDRTTGLVEIFANGHWGTICDYNFDVQDASVLCKMLGYKIGEPEKPVITGKNDVIVKGLNCDGNENDVSECLFYKAWSDGPTCDTVVQNKATIKCSNERVRLVQGVNDYKGRVELQYMGTWGTVCDDHFDTADAEVICREIGIEEKNATIYNSSRFERLNSSFVVQDLICGGKEVDVDNCGSFPWSPQATVSCSINRQNVGVNCRPVTPIRLVNGTNRFSGRVELEYKGSIGTICDRGFDEEDAKVICRTLGFNTMSVGVHKHGYYGEGSGNIIISHLGCVGDEPDISECRATYRWNSPYGYCTHVNDVSVNCDTPVRLSGGWTKYDGLVEIYVNGTWKHVCHDGFSQSDAQTVCNIAGFGMQYQRSSNITIHTNLYYGFHYMNASIGSLGCLGHEDDLFFCGSAKWTTSLSSCNSNESVAVNCRPVTQFRLINKAGDEDTRKEEQKGRVEVQYDNEWGTICDDKFDNVDATVLCQMKGFPHGEVYSDPDNQGKGPIIIDDLDCLGIENDISECRAREWGTHNCEHEEDVMIRCASQKQSNPCKSSEHTRLPNLEYRYVNVKVGDIQSLNDSKLPYRWYTVGNNTMPNTAPVSDSCGTHQPIYSTQDGIPNPDKGIVDFKALQVGRNDYVYHLQMQNCDNRYFVYRLKPTYNELSGYCFGVGSDEPAPDYVAKSVAVTIVQSPRNISLKCKFEPSDKDLLYQVLWTIGDMQQLTKEYYNSSRLDELQLTEQDFEDNDIGLGVNISCAVRAFKTTDGKPGAWSETSRPIFFGIEIKTPELTIRKGESKSIELVNKIPIVCEDGLDELCDVRMTHFTPEFGTCSNRPSFTDGCDSQLSKDSLNVETRINISAAENGQYAVAGHFYIYLTVPAVYGGHIKLWRKTYKLPAIRIDVLPEENKEWRGSLCSARNDPHMYTFDKSYYEHHEDGGEFILYRNKQFRSVEIQHKVAPCTDENDKAKCNCGLAVKAGRDVYVINVCNGRLDIGYKHCGDVTLSVKKENDFTYTVYLPYGTAVRARIDNEPYMGPEGGKVLDISIFPSVHDKEGTTVGLCGTLNGDQRDDFQHRDGSVGGVNTAEFIQSWKVFENESMFSSNVHNMILEPWIFPTCMCKRNRVENTVDYKLACDRSVTECTLGSRTGQHSCGEVSARRTRRSLANKPRIPIVMQTNHYWKNDPHKIVTRQTNTKNEWTKEEAEKTCTDFFHNSTAFNLCRKVPSTNTNISIHNCILDILLTNSTSWIDISVQSMQDTCQTEIYRNSSVFQDFKALVKNLTADDDHYNQLMDTTVTPIGMLDVQEVKELENTIKDIGELSCMNKCSGHGTCSSGKCYCDKPYGSTDCSLDLNKPPRLVDILDKGICDEKDSECTHIYVFGEVFVGTNITCRLKKFTLNVGQEKVFTGHHEYIKGTADSLIEAICPLHHLRRKRSATVGSNDFAFGHEVSVSNDGNNFSNETRDVYIFDSTCQTRENKSDVGMIFDLKDGYCYINGQCVLNGTLNSISKNLVCDTSLSNFSWSSLNSEVSNRKLEDEASKIIVIVLPVLSVVVVIAAVVCIAWKLCFEKKVTTKISDESTTSAFTTLEYPSKGESVSKIAWSLKYSSSKEFNQQEKNPFPIYYGFETTETFQGPNWVEETLQHSEDAFTSSADVVPKSEMSNDGFFTQNLRLESQVTRRPHVEPPVERKLSRGLSASDLYLN